MRLNGEIQHSLTQDSNERLPNLRLWVKNIDASMVVAKTKLTRRAKHALRQVAHRPLLSNQQVAHLCAYLWQRHLVALTNVGRTTHDAQFFCACVHPRIAQVI